MSGMRASSFPTGCSFARLLAGRRWRRPASRVQAAAGLLVLVLMLVVASAADSPRVRPRVSGAHATDTPAPMRVMTAAMIIVGPMPMWDRAWGTR